MECNKFGSPVFTGSNYAIWSARMKLFLLAQGLEVWQIVEDGYTIPSDLSTLSTIEKRRYDCNSRAASLIMGAVVDSELVKIVHLSTTKEMWDKLQNEFLGDENVKTARL